MVYISSSFAISVEFKEIRVKEKPVGNSSQKYWRTVL